MASNPGSPEAVQSGCTCPVLDNGHGRGAYQLDGVWVHWIHVECPLHGPLHGKKEGKP